MFGAFWVAQQQRIHLQCRSHWFDPWVEKSLEEGMTIHSSILAWRISWTEKSDGLHSIEWQRVGHDWSDWAHNMFIWGCNNQRSFWSISQITSLPYSKQASSSHHSGQSGPELCCCPEKSGPTVTTLLLTASSHSLHFSHAALLGSP